MARPSRFNKSVNPLPVASTSSDPTNEPEQSQTGHQSSNAPPAEASNSSAQQPTRSTVNGPTSALTSFLKEQGIRPKHTNRFARRDQSGPSTSAIPEEPEGKPIDEEASDGVDDHPLEEPDSDDLDAEPRAKAPKRPISPSKTMLTKKANPEPQSNNASRNRATPKKPDKLSPEPPLKRKPGKYDDRKPGMIAPCVECGKRFTVTRYTPSEPGRGQVCDACAKEGIGKQANGNNGPPPPKKRKTKKNQPIKHPWSEHTTQTLQMACISVIAKHIETQDAIGSVGSVNLEKICKIVCKHRELKPVNLPLFLDVSHTHLRLFDCINLGKNSLMGIPTFCPHLQHLTLNLCGHLDGEVLTTCGRRLNQLRELDLFGPYLVRREAWLELFSIWRQPRTRVLMSQDPTDGEDESIDQTPDVPRGPEMTMFRLKQSPRFDLDCIQALADTCKNLTALRLDDIGLLDDRALKILTQARFTSLQRLSVANAGILNGATGESLSDASVIQLLESIGSNLEELDISQNKRLTDRVLKDGLAPHCPVLQSLNISGLKELTTAAVRDLFEKWNDTGASSLEYLNLSRCVQVGDSALLAILAHSGSKLKYLDLNSVDELRSDALESLAHQAVSLIDLDVSFVRDVDDFFIKACLDSMPALKSIAVFGNNRVSDLCPSRRGVSIKGQERAIVVV